MDDRLLEELIEWLRIPSISTGGGGPAHLERAAAWGVERVVAYGGSVLNALHALHAMLAAVLPGPDGRLREELRAGIVAPTQAERDSWAKLPSGDEVLAAVGARPVHPGAGAEYYERNGADASLDVNAIHAGEPRTIVPAEATATLTMRLAPRQRAREVLPVLE